MAHFTEDNTEGFTSSDLDNLNRAHKALADKHDADDELAQTIGEMLSSAWFAGATENDLFVAVDAILG